MAWRYSWLRVAPSVAITPIRLFFVVSTAAWAPGRITPTSGTSNSSRAWLSAAAVAVLHAMTTSFTSRDSRYLMMSKAKPRTSS